MFTAKLKSMRGRLLFLLALVIIPIALFNQGLTLFSYWSALDDIDDAQHEVARGYAVSVRRSFENAGSTSLRWRFGCKPKTEPVRDLFSAL